MSKYQDKIRAAEQQDFEGDYNCRVHMTTALNVVKELEAELKEAQGLIQEVIKELEFRESVAGSHGTFKALYKKLKGK